MIYLLNTYILLITNSEDNKYRKRRMSAAVPKHKSVLCSPFLQSKNVFFNFSTLFLFAIYFFACKKVFSQYVILCPAARPT